MASGDRYCLLGLHQGDQPNKEPHHQLVRIPPLLRLRPENVVQERFKEGAAAGESFSTEPEAELEISTSVKRCNMDLVISGDYHAFCMGVTVNRPNSTLQAVQVSI